jgi:hypothetical protein
VLRVAIHRRQSKICAKAEAKMKKVSSSARRLPSRWQIDSLIFVLETASKRPEGLDFFVKSS